MKKIKDVLLVVLALVSVLSAQAATIKGKVIDKETKEPLLGATLFVLGSNQGTTTDLDGSFELKSLRGATSIEISYISYITQVVEINVNSKTPELLFELETDSQTISEVVVSTRKNLENEAALQNERIASNVAIENMGAKEMSIKGISNVQEGVKKITGISVASAGQLIVRGLGDRYSITTLNSQPIASPNPDNKLIPLDIFPSSTVKNITVSKVYDAKSYADYSGAHVDIATKDLTSDDFFSVGLSVSGNSITTGRDYYSMDNVSLFTQSKLSDEVIDYATNNHEIDSYLATHDDAFDTGFNAKGSTALPTFGANMAFGHSYDVGSQQLSVLVSGGVSNGKQADLDSKFLLYENTGNVTDEYYSDNYESTLKIATLGNIGITMRENDRVSYTFFYARNASDKYSLRSGYEYEDGFQMVFSNNVNHIYSLLTHQLNGAHEFGEKLSFHWTGSFTTTSADEPDRRQVGYAQDGNGNLQLFTDKTSATARFFGELNESEWNANGYFDYKFNEVNKISIGAAYRDKKRDYVGRYFYYKMKSTGSVYPYTDPYAADDYIISGNINTVTPTFLDKDSYDAGSSIMSGYLSTDLEFADKLLLNGGVRLEYSEQYVFYNANDSRTYPQTDLFPAFNLRYSLEDKGQLRLAGSRTVTRPSFIEMAPLLYNESYGSAQIKGNAELVNGYNYNVDLRYELFGEGGNMFSLTGYYKHLDSPIERIQSVSGGGEVHTFENAEEGLAAGVEIELSKKIFENLKVGVNGSYMYTNVNLSEDGSYTNSSRELQGASPYLMNADLTYSKYLDDEGRTLTFALLYNLQGPRIATVGTSGRGDIYQAAEHTLNFNASYSISSKMQLSLQLTNLLNRDEIYEQEISGVNHVVESHSYGVGASMGVSLKF